MVFLSFASQLQSWLLSVGAQVVWRACLLAYIAPGSRAGLVGAAVWPSVCLLCPSVGVGWEGGVGHSRDMLRLDAS